MVIADDGGSWNYGRGIESIRIYFSVPTTHKQLFLDQDFGTCSVSLLEIVIKNTLAGLIWLLLRRNEIESESNQVTAVTENF